MKHTTGSRWVVLAVVVAVPRLALAQETSNAFQLGLGTDLVSYSKSTVEIEQTPATQEVDSSVTQWGLSGDSGVNLELGYGVTDTLVVGGLVALGGESSTDESLGLQVESSQFRTLVAPKLDFMFSPGESLRPFVGAAAGLVVSTSKQQTDRVVDQETSATGFGLLGRVGLRWFAAPGLSFDPACSFIWQTLSGDLDLPPLSYDISGSGIAFSLSVGISGWL